MHVLALDEDLVGSLHVLVEDFLGDGNQARMRHPGAVVAGFDLAQLVGADLVQRLLIGHRIVLDGHLRGHAAHGVNLAAMAGLDQQLRIRLQEMPVHGHFAAIGQHEAGMVAEFLDEAEHVIPASAVEAGGVVAQLIQDLVHLERAEDGFDQHRGADGSARHAQSDPERR